MNEFSKMRLARRMFLGGEHRHWVYFHSIMGRRCGFLSPERKRRTRRRPWVRLADGPINLPLRYLNAGVKN
jgi:hypothetical protein